MSQSVVIRQQSQVKTVIAVIHEMLIEGATEVTVKKASEKRRDIQNRLAYHWYEEAEQQTDKDRTEWRAYCKLHHGVGIAKEEDIFRIQYDAVIKPHSYERKLKMMLPPFECQ